MTAARTGELGYQIGAVAKLTGISIDTLRAWERRYGAVAPRREGRDRIYSDADVARLRLLHQAVIAGHSIGRVARLDDAGLRRLAAAPPAVPPPPAAALDRSRLGAALLALDTAAIDHECWRLAVVMPPLELVRDVLMPTLREAGQVWHARRGGIAQEHVISGTVRHLLGSFLRLYLRRDSPVRLLFATPAGDRHELGILSAAMLAASQEFGISYLGPDVPASEIVGAVKAARADVLVLGVTLGRKTQPTARVLEAISRRLPEAVELWAGGPAAARHAPSLGPRAHILPDFDAYNRELSRVALERGGAFPFRAGEPRR